MPATLAPLTTSEAARAAGVSAESIRGWVRSGRLSAERTALGALIDPASLGALIAEREAARRGRRAGA